MFKLLKCMKLTLSLTFLSGLLLVNGAFAQPKNIQLDYEVIRGDQVFATVKERYEQKGNQYRIVSTTKGKGVYALLGEREMTSSGTVTANGLLPEQFQLIRSDHPKKSLSAHFDWANHQLNMLVKGKTRTAELVPKTMDLASYPYQFMFTPPLAEQANISLTTGKRLKQYVYKVVERDVMVNIAGASYKTLHLVTATVDGKKKKELWLAGSKHYLPVKYLAVDKHGNKTEQVLTKISIQ